MLEYFPEDEFDEMNLKPARAISIFDADGRLYPQQSLASKEFWRLARKTPFYEELLLSITALYPGYSDYRTGARKFGDWLLPKGTRRREIAKTILPKGSRRWQFCKGIYYIIRPNYRPHH